MMGINMDMNMQRVVITNPDQQLLVKEIMAFAFKSPKKRLGFDVDDIIFYLAMRDIRTDANNVKHVLALMVKECAFEEFYSFERSKTIYRLR